VLIIAGAAIAIQGALDRPDVVQSPARGANSRRGRPSIEAADFLRASLPYLVESTIDGVGHLLQIQQPEPVARQIAEFLGRNPTAGQDTPLVNQSIASRG
jgi:hypothetical protein